MDTPDQQAADGALERVFDLAWVVGELMNQDLAAQGLTTARAEVLWLLGRDGALTQRALSRLLKCTPRNVTGLVDALQELGLVARKPHPSDRRATLVTLTDQGQATAATWGALHRQGASELFHGISAADLKVFTSVLESVLSRLRADPRLDRHGPESDRPQTM